MGIGNPADDHLNNPPNIGPETAIDGNATSEIDGEFVEFEVPLRDNARANFSLTSSAERTQE